MKVYIIECMHPISGKAEVHIGSESYTTGGASLCHRARLVQPGNGSHWKTAKGAERVLNRVREAHRDTAQWQGYILRVEERAFSTQTEDDDV
jgi:hypothetical protein